MVPGPMLFSNKRQMFGNRYTQNVNARASAPLRAERKDVGATPPYHEAPKLTAQRKSKASAGPPSQGTDRLRHKPHTHNITTMWPRTSICNRTVDPQCLPEQSEAGQNHIHTVGGRSRVSLPLYRMCHAHPMLASAFTQGAPAAQDFPSLSGATQFQSPPLSKKRKSNLLLRLSHS